MAIPGCIALALVGQWLEQPGLIALGVLAGSAAPVMALLTLVGPGNVIIDDELGTAVCGSRSIDLDRVTEVSVDRIVGPSTRLFRTKLRTDDSFLGVFASRWPEEARVKARELASQFNLPLGDLCLPDEPAQAVRPTSVLSRSDRLVIPSRNRLHSLGVWSLYGHGHGATLEHCLLFGLWKRRWSAAALGPVRAIPQSFVVNALGLFCHRGHVLVSTADGGLWLAQGMTDEELAWVAKELRGRLAGGDL